MDFQTRSIRPAANPQAALPLHLTLAMLPWIASLQALPLSNGGLSDLSMLPDVSPNAQKLKEAWGALLKDPLLAKAAEAEARRRAAGFLEGLLQYQQNDFIRDVEEPDIVLMHGSARLLSYGATPDATAILLIPSLINRYYVLDLTQRLSFARHLAGQGLSVFVVDWGHPGASERDFNVALYVTETLVPLTEWIRAHVSGKIIPTGYCMGGLLALALAQIRPDLADAAAFLATPWDFFAPEFPRVALKREEITTVESYIRNCETVPAETIHTLFHCANPYAFQSKLRRFARMDKSHPATQEFLAIEHWVNDGVAMTRGVAQDCLINWTQANAPALGQWRVGGQSVSPSKLRMPCFVAVPEDDRIVPKACALPLAGLLHKPALINPHSGHIGMMVGSRRRANLWEPFAEWVGTQA